MSTPASLHVRLLGGFGVAVAGRDVPDSAWRRRQAAALVKLLALEPVHRLHREQVIEALWPESDPEAAANSLRVTLHRARRPLEDAGAVPGAFLGRDGEEIVLGPPDRVRVDVDAFEAAVTRAWRTPDTSAAQTALDLYTGDVLPGDPYEEWIAGRRTALRTSYLSLLAHLAQLHEGQDQLGRALSVVQRWLAAEPLDEAAHAALIRLLARFGRRRQALAHYDRLVALLERELGTEPETATSELAAAVRDGRFPDATRPVDAAPPPRAGAGLPAGIVPDDLIGRERESAELRHLLASSRILTLTGPGGVGKTRLALAVARAAADLCPDGICFVDLAPLGDRPQRAPDLVLAAVVRALGVGEEGGQPDLDAVTAFVGEKRLLVVLDNVERWLAAAPLLAELTAGCPRLRVLVTSRSRLRLRGEQEYPVQPLAVPDRIGAGGRSPGVGAVAGYPAVALFARRAREARPDFALTEGNAEAVGEICRRLDGLPLAIELAAARVRILSPPALLERLRQPLAVLTEGPRDAPARQRTLRAAIAWSHELLDPGERVLFARLAAFAGGCALEAAEAVCADDGAGRIAGRPIFDGVAALVEQSLLRTTSEPAAPPRFGMLETIREFALERLEASGEVESIRRRHAAFFLALAERAEPHLTGPECATWLARLETEHDNLRAALRTLDGQGESSLRLVGALWRFWWLHGHLSEGRAWLERALARGDGVSGSLRAQALDGAGALAEAQGDHGTAVALHEAALRLWRAAGDRRGIVRALMNLGLVADEQGDPGRATALLADALGLAREAGDRHGIAAALANLGQVALAEGELEPAASWFGESVALYRELGDQRNLAAILANVGVLAFLTGDLIRAARCHEEALALLQGLGDRQGEAAELLNLGHTIQRQGDLDRAGGLFAAALDRFEQLGDRSGEAAAVNHLGRLARPRGEAAEAEAYLTRGLSLGRQIDDRISVAEALEGLAAVACDGGEPARGARLIGAAEALREAIGVPLPAVYEADYRSLVTAARAVLGDAAFAAARATGYGAAPETVVAQSPGLAAGDPVPS